jgi:hypothetical protein
MGGTHISQGFCVDATTATNICCGAALDIDDLIDEGFPGTCRLTHYVRLAYPFSMKINWRNNSPFVSHRPDGYIQFPLPYTHMKMKIRNQYLSPQNAILPHLKTSSAAYLAA